MTKLKTRMAVLNRDGWLCQVCGHKGSYGTGFENIQVHHILPLRLGGSDNMDNLVTLCIKCHGVADRELRETSPGKILGFVPRTSKWTRSRQKATRRTQESRHEHVQAYITRQAVTDNTASTPN